MNKIIGLIVLVIITAAAAKKSTHQTSKSDNQYDCFKVFKI